MDRTLERTLWRITIDGASLGIVDAKDEEHALDVLAWENHCESVMVYANTLGMLLADFTAWVTVEKL